MNVQIACTIYGKLAWISDPVNGSRHDNHCQEESGVLLTMNPKNWIGDKGYIGNNMITPFRKPAGSELLDWQKEYNSQVNRIRWMIEQVISHFKNWTIMHTDYRRPLETGLSRQRLCRTFGGDAEWPQPRRIRWRRRVKPARPYICLLIILVLVLTPSVRPL